MLDAVAMHYLLSLEPLIIVTAFPVLKFVIKTTSCIMYSSVPNNRPPDY